MLVVMLSRLRGTTLREGRKVEVPPISITALTSATARKPGVVGFVRLKGRHCSSRFNGTTIHDDHEGLKEVDGR